MKTWIDRETIDRLGTGLSLQMTANFNHEGCTAGEDTRQRLYITRLNDGTLLAYCHNCGGRGYSRSNSVTNIHTYRPENMANNTMTGELIERGQLKTVFGMDPGLFQPITYGYHPIVDEFISKYGVDPLLAWSSDGWRVTLRQFDGIAYMWLFLPIYDTDGCLMGAEMKRLGHKTLFDYDKKVTKKTLTFGTSTPQMCYDPRHEPHTVVIVEDRISAHRVVQIHGFAAYCLHGTKKLSGVEAHKLAMTYNNVVVWLDNDSDYVKDVAGFNADLLYMFTQRVHIATTKEPKAQTRIFIHAYLNSMVESLDKLYA